MERLGLGLITIVFLGGLALFFARVPAQAARRVWLIAFTVLLATGVTTMDAHAFIAKWGFRGDDARDGLEHMMDGTAHRPFVYRRLAPELVRLGTDVSLRVLPPGAIRYLTEESNLKRYRVSWYIAPESWTTRKAVAFHVAYVLVWLGFLGTLFAGAALLRSLRGSSGLESVTTVSVAMCFLPLMFIGGGYLYDSTELLLWTTLLLCAVNGWFHPVPPLFALMLCNKESALIAAAVLFPIFHHHFGKRKALIWTAALGAMGALWLAFIRIKYADLPGAARESWFFMNMEFWSNPKNYFLFTQAFSPVLPAPRGANVLLLVFVFIPLRFGLPAVRADIRWATAIAGAILVPLFLTSCFHDEIRNLSLLFPLLFMVIVEGVHTLMRETQPVRVSATPGE